MKFEFARELKLKMSSTVPVTKKTKMSDLIQHRLKVSTIDSRFFTGTLLAFDKHLNLVLQDTEESRITKKGYQQLIKDGGVPKYDKRVLGLVILRGDQVVSLSIELGKVLNPRDRIEKSIIKGKGKAKPLKHNVIGKKV